MMTTEKKIVWLLDVDGVVVNVWRPTWGAELVLTKVSRSTIRYSPELIHWMRTEPLLDGVELIWSTTWNYYPQVEDVDKDEQ